MKNKYTFAVNTDKKIQLLLTNLLQNSITSAKNSLQAFASETTFVQSIDTIFNYQGSNWLQYEWQSRNVEFPTIKIVNGAVINNANGAYAEQTNTIYLASEFLFAHQSNTDVVAAVLLEEYGHYLDNVINSVDTPGDEGAIFSAIVRGQDLADIQLQQLRNEDDSAIVNLDGETIQIEQATGSNPFYEYKTIAQTGLFGFGSIGRGVSINDSGNIAFSVGGTVNADSVYVKFEGKDNPVDITGFNRDFGNYVQINNNNKVVATDRDTVSTGASAIRIWDANNPENHESYIGANIVADTPFDFNAILFTPSISDTNEFVFSALDRSDFTVATTSYYATNSDFDVFQNTLNLGQGAQRIRPMMDASGNFVMRFLDRDSSITLFKPTRSFTGRTFETTGIATGADGFSNRGLSPGISDDGNFIVFAAENPNLGGKGIFLSFKDASSANGRTIYPISLVGNGNNIPLPNSLLEIPAILSDFEMDSRVAVSSRVFRDDNRSITVAYIGYDQSGNKGLYTTKVNLFGDRSSAFDPNDPGFVSPQPPILVAEKGQTINGLVIDDIDIYDPINSQDQGELAFWIETSNGDEAIIKAEQQKVIVLDFNPDSTNLSSFSQNLFSNSGVTGGSWQGGLQQVFSFYNRSDLVGDIADIKNEIVRNVQQKFDAVKANIKVVSSDNAPPSEDGAVTRVLIGDSPFSPVNSLYRTPNKNNPNIIDGGILYGIASSVDLFDQDIFYGTIDVNNDGIVGNAGDTPLFLPFGEDTAFVFADNIFRKVDVNNDGVFDLGAFTDNLAGMGQLVDLSDTSEIAKFDVVNALTNVIAHEVGHSLGLSHLDNTKEDLLMNQSPESALDSASGVDEIRIIQHFSDTDIALEEYPGQQSDRNRLAFNVGSSDRSIDRDPPTPAELNALQRSKLSIGSTLNSELSSLAVASAFIGIVPNGEYDAFPYLIDLGSGNLGDLLADNIPVGEEDQVIFGASTDGNGIDIFGVPGESIDFVEDIDLSNPLLITSTNLIRSNLFNDSGELAAAPLELYQETDGGLTQIGTLSVSETEPNSNGGDQNPVAEDDTFSFDYGASLTGNVLTNDSDPNGDELTINIVPVENTVRGSVSLESDGSFSYYAPDFIGTDSFVYEVSNSEGNTNTAKVTLSVSPNIEFSWQVGEIELIEDSRLTAPLADGGFVTVSNQAGTEFLPGNLMGQRYDASGQPVGNSFLIHTWATPGQYTGYAGNVSLSSSPNGGFLVVLNDSPTLEKDIYIYDENADLIVHHESVLSNESGYRSGGSITGNSSTALQNGNYIIIPDFQYTASPNNEVSGFIGIEIYDANTGKLVNSETDSIFDSETKTIDNNNIVEGTTTIPEIQNLRQPEVATLSNGGFVVGYIADKRNVNTGEFESGLFAQVFDGEGNKLENNITVAGSPFNNLSSATYSLAGLEEGGFVITYENYSQLYRLEDSTSQTGNFFEADVIPDNEGLVAQRYDNNGNALGDLIAVKTGASGIDAPFVPSITTLNDGKFLITNTSSITGESYNLFSDQPTNEFRGQLFNADGTPIGSEFIIEEYQGFLADINSSAFSLDYTRQLSIAALEDGTLLLTGKENDNDAEPNDYADDYVFTQRLKLNITEDEDGTEVSVEPIGSASTLAQYAGENPPFDPQPVPKTDDDNGNNGSDTDSKLSINDVSVAEGNEGNTELVFTISLSEASEETITVNYATRDDIAIASEDYTTTEGTIEFAPGETEKTITVPVLADTDFEEDETFDLRLSNPSNASLADGRGIATITNDDSTAEITITINDASVVEGNENNSKVTLTVTLSEASEETITLDYATVDDSAIVNEDYINTEGTLEFAPGETEKTIDVFVLSDTEIEQHETFDVRLSNPINGVFSDSRGVITITNDDVTTPSDNRIELFRMRNKTFDTGTYVFVGEAERDFILNDPNLSNTFALDGVASDGTMNPAFTASTEDGDDLIPFYRLESLTVAGTFLFVSTAEYDFIFDDPTLSQQWKKQGFDESGETDIAEFYLLDSSADMGIQFNRFQNTQNNTFLYAGEAETEAILDNPNLSSLFKDQGFAFESFV